MDETSLIYPLLESLQDSLKHWIHEVLTYHRIIAVTLEFVGRAETTLSPGQTVQSRARLTALISAQRVAVDDKWFNGAREIRISFLLHTKKARHPGAKELLRSLLVEILDSTRNHPMYMFPVLEHEEIFGQRSWKYSTLILYPLDAIVEADLVRHRIALQLFLSC